jgi:hypothetical protein
MRTMLHPGTVCLTRMIEYRSVVAGARPLDEENDGSEVADAISRSVDAVQRCMHHRVETGQRRSL